MVVLIARNFGNGIAEQGERLRGDGATVINIAVDGKLAGLIAIADPVKPSTPDALKALAAEGIKVIMLTGDNLCVPKTLNPTIVVMKSAKEERAGSSPASW